MNDNSLYFCKSLLMPDLRKLLQFVLVEEHEANLTLCGHV